MHFSVLVRPPVRKQYLPSWGHGPVDRKGMRWSQKAMVYNSEGCLERTLQVAVGMNRPLAPPLSQGLL